MSTFFIFGVTVLSAVFVDCMNINLQNELKEFVHEFEISESKNGPTLKAFSWKDCSNGSSILNIKSLSLSPDPLAFPGPLTVATSFILKEDASQNLSANLYMAKKVLGEYIEIPCIDGFGSCIYDNLCNDLSQIGDQCPDPVKKLIGDKCTCPIKQGSYTLPKSTIDITADVIPSGGYKIIANVSKNGKPAACLEIELTIE